MRTKEKLILFISMCVLFILMISAVNATEENNTQLTTDGVDTYNGLEGDISNNVDVLQESSEGISQSTDLKNYPTDSISNSSDEGNMSNVYDYVITLNKDNYMDYDGYEYESNTLISIDDVLEGCFIEVYNPNITITSTNNGKLVNSYIFVENGANATIENITMEVDDTTEFEISIELEGDGNHIRNLTIVDHRQSLDYEYYSLFLINGDNNTIENCTFDVIYPACNIDWSYYSGHRRCVLIKVYGENNYINHNKFNVLEGKDVEYNFGTLETMHICGNNNTITYNDIFMKGTLFLYGITCFYNNNTIAYNNITVLSGRYANGVSIDGEVIDCNVHDNNITVRTNNSLYDPTLGNDSAYGVIIIASDYHGYEYDIEKSKSLVRNNIIQNNNISGYASHMYAIEQFGGHDTKILGNKIDIDGVYTMGVGIIGADSVISNNSIKISGLTNRTGSSPDYLAPQTTGIYSFWGNKTRIYKNDIIVVGGPAITLHNDVGSDIGNNNITVTGNEMTIISRGFAANATVHNNTLNQEENSISIGDNVVSDNTYPSSQQIPTGDIQNNDTLVNDTVDVNDTVIDDNSTESNNTNVSNSTNTTDVTTDPETPEIDDNTTNTTDIILPDEPVVPVNQTTEPIVENQTEPIVENQTVPVENQTVPVENDTNIPEINETTLQNETIDDNSTIEQNNTQEEPIIDMNNTNEDPQEIQENSTIPENTTIPENKTIPENITIPENTTVPENITVPENTTIPENPVIIENNTQIIEEPTNNTKNQTIIENQTVTPINIPEKQINNTNTTKTNTTITNTTVITNTTQKTNNTMLVNNTTVVDNQPEDGKKVNKTKVNNTQESASSIGEVDVQPVDVNSPQEDESQKQDQSDSSSSVGTIQNNQQNDNSQDTSKEVTPELNPSQPMEPSEVEVLEVFKNQDTPDTNKKDIDIQLLAITILILLIPLCYGVYMGTKK